MSGFLPERVTILEMLVEKRVEGISQETTVVTRWPAVREVLALVFLQGAWAPPASECSAMII